MRIYIRFMLCKWETTDRVSRQLVLIKKGSINTQPSTGAYVGMYSSGDVPESMRLLLLQ